MKRALITGITGQDGSYLAEFLLSKSYRIFGFARNESWGRPNAASHLKDDIEIVFGDMREEADIAAAIQKVAPDEIYNFASQSRPGQSWTRVPETLIVNGLGAVHLFEAVKNHVPQSRVYHASSSEMFGQTSEGAQDENSPFNPVNPYAVAKVYAHQMAKIYRKNYGLFIANGILFNHESERRPIYFLTQKVAYGAACAALEIVDSPDLNEMGRPIVENGRLALGNLDIARDWGYAPDFVRAIWAMLQQDTPDDYVIGTGYVHTLKELCKVAYDFVGIDWKDRVFSDKDLVRPLDFPCITANPQRAFQRLGWSPLVKFEEMVQSMVESQLKRLKAISRSKENR